jgi:nicotinamide mononucleotide transporter
MTDLLLSLWEELRRQHPAELGAVLTALLYLWYATRASAWCWVWEIVSCTLWAYAAYAIYALYGNALLQGFYAVVSIWGIYQWRRGAAGKPLPITRMKPFEHAGLLAVGTLLSLLLGYLAARFTNGASTYLDASTTVFSILTTLLVIYKKLENWLYWLVIDSVYVYLYWQQGSLLFTLLFVVFILMAAYGFLRWRRQMRLVQEMP